MSSNTVWPDTGLNLSSALIVFNFIPFQVSNRLSEIGAAKGFQAGAGRDFLAPRGQDPWPTLIRQCPLTIVLKRKETGGKGNEKIGTAFHFFVLATRRIRFLSNSFIKPRFAAYFQRLPGPFPKTTMALPPPR